MKNTLITSAGFRTQFEILQYIVYLFNFILVTLTNMGQRKKLTKYHKINKNMHKSWKKKKH